MTKKRKADFVSDSGRGRNATMAKREILSFRAGEDGDSSDAQSINSNESSEASKEEEDKSTSRSSASFKEFSIDALDYYVVLEMLLGCGHADGESAPLWQTVQEMVEIQEDDDDRRVCMLRCPDEMIFQIFPKTLETLPN